MDGMYSLQAVLDLVLISPVMVTHPIILHLLSIAERAATVLLFNYQMFALLGKHSNAPLQKPSNKI